MTFSTIAPADLEDARKLYSSPFVSGVLRDQPGYRFHHWLESAERPGEVVSLTAWESQADAERYEHSGLYTELGKKFQEWFHTQRELRSYEVRE